MYRDIQSILDDNSELSYYSQAPESGYDSRTPTTNSNPSSARETPVDKVNKNLENTNLMSVHSDVIDNLKNNINDNSKTIKMKRKYRKRQTIRKENNTNNSDNLSEETITGKFKRKYRVNRNHERKVSNPKDSPTKKKTSKNQRRKRMNG